MRSATRPDLVIFDCDGVLIDSELVQRRIDAELFTRFGYPVTVEELVHGFAGRTTADVRQHIDKTLGRSMPAEFGEQRMRLVDQAYREEVKTTAGVRKRSASSISHSAWRPMRAPFGYAISFYEQQLTAAGAIAVFNDMNDLMRLIELQ
jgi:beta-phosphoglucomutase-like phosphatase (HAD superfamily)